MATQMRRTQIPSRSPIPHGNTRSSDFVPKVAESSSDSVVEKRKSLTEKKTEVAEYLSSKGTQPMYQMRIMSAIDVLWKNTQTQDIWQLGYKATTKGTVTRF